MTHTGEYTPPATGASLLRRQDEVDALRLLIAQKRLYSRAKRWVAIRWFGMLVIGLAAPIVAVIWPQSSVIVGSIAGAWLFLGRTLLMHAQKKRTEQAAAVQEQFDFYVYEMPPGTPRPKLPSLEDISLAAGHDGELVVVAEKEEMLGWYVVAKDDPGETAVAVAQRSNAAYSYRLLRFTGIIWSVVAVLWAAALTTICIVTGLTLVTFLLGVVLPLLPAFLDVTDYIVGILRSARDREALYREIESRIGNKDEPITGENLRVWQEALFELRRDTPAVPDLIYKLQRRKNEAAMSAAATQLSKRASGGRMTTTSQAMAQFLSDISVTDYQKTSIINSRKDRVVENLTAAFPDTSDLPFSRAILMGSAAKGTIVRPIDDIDVLAVFSNANGAWNTYRFDSQAFLYRVRRAYNGLSTAQVGARGQAVRIFFENGGHVDVAPVFSHGNDVYGLPGGDGGWINTAPTVANAWFAKKHADLGYNLAPLVLLLKKWNNAHSKRLRSFHLETITASTFKTLGSNRQSALASFFEWAPSHLDVGDPGGQSGTLSGYLTWAGRQEIIQALGSAAERARKANEAEARGDHDEAKRLWQIVLGSSFPK